VPQPLAVEEALALARDLAQSGDLANAAGICAKILQAAPGQPHALHLLGMAAFQQGHAREAVELLRRAVRSDPHFAVASNDLGNLLAQQGMLAEAAASYRRAIAEAPDFAEAHNNLGNLLQMASSLEEAVNCYRTALGLRPGYAEAFRNLGSALRRLGRPDEAATALRAALAINPGFAAAIAQLAHQSKELCDWSQLDDLTAELIEIVEAGSAAVNPFVFLSLDATPREQLLCARRWVAEHLGAAGKRPAASKGEDRIMVGYLSGDFQEHATAHLIAELFELHDRVRFRVIGYSYGRDDGSAARRQLRATFDGFEDLLDCSHAESAARIRAAGVDILVDLKGYTTDARPEILVLRPAPVQVSYLVYPGTLGSDAVDYILVDPVVVPADEQPYFTEQLVHLPDCYQVNQRRRPIARHVPARHECALPEAGFVFCCFSSAYKITARMFDIWMRLLAGLPGSVLWLLEPNATAMANLRREAETRLPGGAARLVFAPSLPNPEHLARFALADLFLDTLPYNAHTLTSDALWGGCPVITCAGRAFAGRVAESLLRAVGLPELATQTLAEYETLAFDLARNPDRLQAIRGKLEANRLTTALFDSLRFTRHLESAFETMWRRQVAGESPRSFAVAPNRPPPRGLRDSSPDPRTLPSGHRRKDESRAGLRRAAPRSIPNDRASSSLRPTA
jgi:predicted O-linked N-acetylglucosamine transferase (SPINDLY family)